MKRLLLLCGLLLGVLTSNAQPLQVQAFAFLPIPCGTTGTHAQIAIVAQGGSGNYSFQLFDDTTTPSSTVGLPVPGVAHTPVSFMLTTDHDAYHVVITDTAPPNNTATFSLFSSAFTDTGIHRSFPLEYTTGQISGIFSPNPSACDGSLLLAIQVAISGTIAYFNLRNIDSCPGQVIESDNCNNQPFSPFGKPITPGNWQVQVVPNTTNYNCPGAPCNVPLFFTFSNPNQPLSLSANSVTTSTCGKKNAGSINFQVTGGVGPFVYFLSDSTCKAASQRIPKITGTTNATSGTFTDVANGTYCITVADFQNTNAVLCVQRTQVTVNNKCAVRPLMCCIGK
jgi:hypothetical protein